MIFERRISISNRNYYLGVELKYENGKLLTKLNGSYFDMGDFSIMIDCVEKSYEKESKKLIYDKENPAMNNIIYLYDRFPFVCYIKESLYGGNGIITMNKNEIINYINANKIQVNRWDKNSCRCPLLYE